MIKGGRIEAIHPPHRPQADKDDKGHRQPKRNPAVAPRARQGVPPRLRAAVPAPQGKAGNHCHQQHASAQKPPAKGGQQRKGGQHPHPQHQAAALPFSGIAHQRQQTQQRKDTPGQHQGEPKGHGPQSIQPGQIPQGRRQQRILAGAGQNPSCQRLSHQPRRIPRRFASYPLSVQRHFSMPLLFGISWKKHTTLGCFCQ